MTASRQPVSDRAYEAAVAYKEALDRHSAICDRCGAPIIWARTKKSPAKNNIALDPYRADQGKRYRVKVFRDFLEAEAMFLDKERYTPGHRCHFDTCEAKEASEPSSETTDLSAAQIADMTGFPLDAVEAAAKARSDAGRPSLDAPLDGVAFARLDRATQVRWLRVRIRYAARSIDFGDQPLQRYPIAAGHDPDDDIPEFRE